MSEDNLVSRVLQQSPELVKRKLKACEVRMDNTKPLNWDCYIKAPICEVDPELLRFVKEHCALQEKLDIAINTFEEIYAWYKDSIPGEMAKEALAKIKKIK